MRDSSRMVKQIQFRRSTVHIFGADPDDVGSCREEGLKLKKLKIVDWRASKSPKIRRQVPEKEVNVMAPQPMNLPPMAPKLFENLFGLKTRHPASAV